MVNLEQATFAGGCFWCMQQCFEILEGVSKVQVGYMAYQDNAIKNPSYEQICTGNSGHLEVVKMTFDTAIIDYEKLLKTFFRQIDPTDDQGQFADKGSQYLSAILFHNEIQKNHAETMIKTLDQAKIFNKKVCVQVLEARVFYAAEAYHQDYYKNNPQHYQRYSIGSGRKAFISNCAVNYESIGF